MDNLDRDAIAATAVGMSYGAWKAQHPHTNPDRQPEIFDVDDISKIVRCKYCGKKFIRTSRYLVVCSDECRAEYRRKHNREQMARARVSGLSNRASEQPDLDEIFGTTV